MAPDLLISGSISSIHHDCSPRGQRACKKVKFAPPYFLYLVAAHGVSLISVSLRPHHINLYPHPPVEARRDYGARGAPVGRPWSCAHGGQRYESIIWSNFNSLQGNQIQLQNQKSATHLLQHVHSAACVVAVDEPAEGCASTNRWGAPPQEKGAPPQLSSPSRNPNLFVQPPGRKQEEGKNGEKLCERPAGKEIREGQHRLFACSSIHVSSKIGKWTRLSRKS